METEILIVGGGACGLAAAIMAARQGKNVAVLEHRDRIGKKLLATGNGKCNYTNVRQSQDCYYSENPSFPRSVLNQFGYEETIRFFSGLGIYPDIKNGCVYPRSGQASSVLSVLRMELSHLGAAVLCSVHVDKIKKERNWFRLSAAKDEFFAGRVILCTGGMANSRLGSDGSGYKLARQLGHRIIQPVPALTGLAAVEKDCKAMAGVRIRALITLLINEEAFFQEKGEVQLTAYGISGIPVFQISRFAARALERGKKTEVVLDFFPELSEEALCQLLEERGRESYKTLSGLLVGLLNEKLIPVLLKRCGLGAEQSGQRTTRRDFQRLSEVLKRFLFTIRDTNGFEQAQVTAGGVDTREVEETTLMSRLVDNLYFAGEILDVDGSCGGYNLQWAWASGAVAGRSAAGAGISKGSRKESAYAPLK